MKNINLYLLFASALFFSCSENLFSPSADSPAGASRGGSTAKFAISGNTLFVVENEYLNLFDISVENETVFTEKLQVGWGIETIFSFGDLLFLGTQTGVLIFDISVPSKPQFISDYAHIVSCDPVVTDGKYAYITLRTGTNCGLPVNELQILDLSDIRNPVLINSLPMTNPRGLAINKNTLYVCDEGIKVLDVTDKMNIVTLGRIKDLPANDVIFFRDRLLVTADDGFYQFDAENFSPLSFYTFE